MSDAVAKFIDALGKSLSAGTFVKLVLGNYRGEEEHLQKVLVRPIDTRKGRRVMIQTRYDTREIAKNFEPAAAVEQVRDLLRSGFRSGHLFTTFEDFQLTAGKKSSRLVSGKATFTQKPAAEHDRKKTKLIDQYSFYLRSLGITTDDGKVRSNQQDKWRQINKYLEVLRDLFDGSPIKDKRRLRIVDMGSGKGYLTFAAYDYFTNVRGFEIDMTGVELRGELVELGNQIAEASGFAGLNFVTGTIADFELGEVDILIALHACDTATDDALYKGIRAQASIIVAAPCCHREIRRQIRVPEVLRDVLKHGTMLEREAETITDGLRSMILERSGYMTKVFEFVPMEHTPKNNMIAATRSTAVERRSAVIAKRIDALKAFYGIEEQRLENLLA